MKHGRSGKGVRKDERRARRKATDRRHDEWRVRPLRDGLDPEQLRSIQAAAHRMDPDRPWSELAPRVLPMIKRAWHPYPPDAEPLTLTVAPGIRTGFGIDLGPAFGHVSQAMLDRWGVDAMTVLAASLDNLRRSAAATPPRVERVPYDGWQVTSIAGQGWGSALLLVPDVLQPILRDEEQVLLAPVRNHLLALSPDADLETAAALWGALADGAADQLDVPILFWDGVSVVPVLDGPDRRVH